MIQVEFVELILVILEYNLALLIQDLPNQQLHMKEVAFKAHSQSHTASIDQERCI